MTPLGYLRRATARIMMDTCLVAVLHACACSHVGPFESTPASASTNERATRTQDASVAATRDPTAARSPNTPMSPSGVDSVDADEASSEEDDSQGDGWHFLPHKRKKIPAKSVATLEERIDDTTLTVEFYVDDMGLARNEVMQWIADSARAVAAYYGGFPVPSLRVEIVEGRRPGVGFGQAFAGRRIRLYLGRQTTREQLEADWVLVHEMLHMGFPMLEDRHRWMREGLSTYLEPIVRARAGWVSEADIWARWLERMPYGLPAADDRGLDRTQTWGNTYWGGALFWLLLDVEVRRKSNNSRSIEPLLQHVVENGGHARVTWPIERVCRRADAGIGSSAFSDLYQRVATQPISVDLEELWRELGVSQRDGQVVFDDDAPLAPIRRAITRG